jgi:hypothetical protein
MNAPNENPQAVGAALRADTTDNEHIQHNTTAQEAGSSAAVTMLAEFYTIIWSSTGIYALFTLPDKQHYQFTTIAEAVAKTIELDAAPGVEAVYHACASFKEPKIVATDGKVKFRIQENANKCKALWADIDCGDKKADEGRGYATKKAALAAVTKFLREHGLPQPTYIIDSGHGLHLYWAFIEEVEAKDWTATATMLDRLFKAAKLLVDPSRTKDCSSVLRPPGTTNRKDPDAPKTVTIKYRGGLINFEKFKTAIDAAATKYGIVPAKADDLNAPPDFLQGETGNLSYLGVTEYPPSDADRVAEYCSQIRHFKGTGGATEPIWHACVGVTKHCVEGEAKVHQWSGKYDGYDPAETQAKLDNWATGPTTCDKFKEINPTGCAGCPHSGRVKSPISLGYAVPEIAKIECETSLLGAEAGRIEIIRGALPKRDYVIQGYAVAGKPYVLGGKGGVSKTQKVMQQGTDIACGVGTVPGAVMLILAEEDQGEIALRFSQLAKSEAWSDEKIDLVQSRIRAYGLAGIDVRLTKFAGGSLEHTPFPRQIIDASAALSLATGLPVRMIVLDHAGLIHGGDFNAREDVARTMQQVSHIAQETGAAVFVLAHSPKGATNAESSESDAVAGSTAWVDNARGAQILATMRPNEAKLYGISDDMRAGYVSAAIVKNNYGPTGEIEWFYRGDGGVLKPVTMTVPVKAPKGSGVLQTAILEFIKERPGQFAKTGLRDTHGGKDGRFKASKAEMQAAIENLISSGQMVLREVTPEMRKQFGHHHTVKQVMEAKI